MTITLNLTETSQPITYTNVLNTYTKGPLFCIYIESGIVYKHPIGTIWRVKEEYGPKETSK